MKKSSKLFAGFVFAVLFLFGTATFMESTAWARAGGGGSFGSRGSRSFSAPRMPSSPSQSSPGFSAPGRNPMTGVPGQQSGGFFSRSPFMQGLAGGLAGGMLGSLLFGGVGHAAGSGTGGGGMGLLDMILIGLLLYFAYRFFKRRRAQQSEATAYYGGGPSEPQGYGASPGYYPEPQPEPYLPASDADRGFQQIRQFDPNFNEEALKEELQDNFFRIQAAWMNLSLDGVEGMLTPEMAEFFRNEFQSMKEKGRVNRLENIAVRKVEPAEAWQEAGKDYVTVLFTANLLDYTVDMKSGEVVSGDKLNPVKFQEFWTFCRDIGTSRWKLSAINQMDEASPRLN